MFDDMQKMMQRMQSLMDNSFGEAPLARPFLLPSGNVESRLTKTPSMALHVVEKPEGYEVQAELPGVKKEDIKVEVHDNQVAISALQPTRHHQAVIQLTGQLPAKMVTASPRSKRCARACR